MLKIPSFLRGVVLLALLPILVGGCSDENPERERLALEALEAIQADYADSELERGEKRTVFAPLFDSVAADYWGTRAGLEARFEQLYHSTYDMEDEEKDPALAAAADSILSHYGESKHLAVFTDWLHLFNDGQEEGYVARIRNESPHAEVRAAAIFEPANSMKSRLRYGRIEDTVAAKAEIEANLNLLIEEYGDTPKGSTTFGVLADALLNSYTDEELAVGQPAPEVVGRTVDGEEILLSQFKGKVTVFYFWGDW